MDLELAWQRLLKKVVVDPTVVGPDGLPCWIWTGKSVSPNGYPKISIARKYWRVSRFIGYTQYDLERLEAEAGHKLVMRHTCDHRRCIRPEHFLPGTHRDNTRDALRRKRGVGGKPSLTEDQVKQLRQEHAEGTSIQSLSRKFGRNQNTIRRYLVPQSRLVRLTDVETALRARIDTMVVETLLAELDQLSVSSK